MSKIMKTSFKRMQNHIFKIIENRYRLINLIQGRNMILIKKISSRVC